MKNKYLWFKGKPLIENKLIERYEDIIHGLQVSLPLTMCTLAARLTALTFILAFQVGEE